MPDLNRFALEIRIGVLEQLRARGFGHIGGSFSLAETLAVLYGEIMKVDPQNPEDPDRDRLILSKGHAGPALYAALALKGFFPYEELKTLNQPGTRLPSHCDAAKTPGVDISTGSLGQGCSLAVGLALGDSMRGRKNRHFLIVGDGELDEGQVWEAAMFTAAHHLTGLTWLIDWNKRQLDGPTSRILELFDPAAKFESFGFEAVRVDGHDPAAICRALKAGPRGEKPLVVILDTVKGKGIPEIEEADNHSMHLPEETWEKYLVQMKQELKEKYPEAACGGCGEQAADACGKAEEKPAGQTEESACAGSVKTAAGESAYHIVYNGENDPRAIATGILAPVLQELAKEDPDIVFLDADLMGPSGVRKWWQEEPERVINIGIAEANMAGIACGLAACGYKPYIHSFAPFATRRCFDQLMLSGAFAGNHITVIGSDPGVLMAFNGATHMSFEDIGLMRQIPGATVISISDGTLLEDVVKKAKDLPGVVYISMPRKQVAAVYGQGSTFAIGKGNVVRDGADVTIAACGIMVAEAMAAAKLLEERGISAAVLDLFTAKPLDEELILAYGEKTGAILTAENHRRAGGLYEAVSGAVCAAGPQVKKPLMDSAAIEDRFGEVGSVDYLKGIFHITAKDLADKAERLVKLKQQSCC